MLCNPQTKSNVCCNQKLENQSNTALQNVVSELARVIRSQRRDRQRTSPSPQTFLKSLRHNQNTPPPVFGDAYCARTPFRTPLPRSPPLTTGQLGSSSSSASESYMPRAFHVPDGKISPIPVMFGAPRHYDAEVHAINKDAEQLCPTMFGTPSHHDAELHAISTEAEQLRAKLALLEHKKAVRTQQLCAYRKNYEDTHFVSIASHDRDYASLDDDADNDWLSRRSDEDTINIFQRWRNEKQKPSEYAVHNEKEKILFRRLLDSWTNAQPKQRDENDVTLLGVQIKGPRTTIESPSSTLLDCVPRVPLQDPHSPRTPIRDPHSVSTGHLMTPPPLCENQTASVQHVPAHFSFVV